MRDRKKDIAAGAAFIALIAGFLLLINLITNTSDTQESQLVYNAVRHAALTCYAAEGSYPDSLQYLRDHYKLAYNQDKYIVEYDAFASNLMPTINVRERGNIDK